MSEGEPLRLVRLLSAPERLRVFSALVLGATGSTEIADHAGVPEPDAVRALTELEQGGLVGRDGNDWFARTEELRNVVAATTTTAAASMASTASAPFATASAPRATPTAPAPSAPALGAHSTPPDPPIPCGREEAAIFRAFTRDGRILAMPIQRSKRLVLLDYVARTFEPGVRYTESEVNAVLRTFYGDHALLRRYLVDEGFLDRDTTHYWRCGGTVEV
ncbi:DUF2087 domain-containing protein [Nocardiopsis gilva YIM 90087]|uniref:DUF2087 domain-containing protein n=1 Tax=Nocardiopsis gilva YIM 90087 TaxID=1235441 RepID=A0A223S3M5_9ACTN|nr:DUF2087 domain-containing protein [Nocardiopsis gilva YIM 90087]